MPSGDVIADRLRAALTADPQRLTQDATASRAVITARLRDACAMSTVCFALARLNPAAPAQSRAAEPSEPT